MTTWMMCLAVAWNLTWVSLFFEKTKIFIQLHIVDSNPNGVIWEGIKDHEDINLFIEGVHVVMNWSQFRFHILAICQSFVLSCFKDASHLEANKHRIENIIYINHEAKNKEVLNNDFQIAGLTQHNEVSHFAKDGSRCFEICYTEHPPVLIIQLLLRYPITANPWVCIVKHLSSKFYLWYDL